MTTKTQAYKNTRTGKVHAFDARGSLCRVFGRDARGRPTRDGRVSLDLAFIHAPVNCKRCRTQAAQR